MFLRTSSNRSRRTQGRHGVGQGWKLNLQLLEDRSVPTTIVVTNNLDMVAVDGTVSIREAFTSINNGANINADVVAVGGYGAADMIAFSGVASPISLPAGQLTVSKAVTVTGPGSAVLTIQNTAAASATSNVFKVTHATGLVTMSGMTITGGNLAVNNGGGISVMAAGNLTLVGVTITGNMTKGIGGGVFNQSTGILTLISSTISGNSAVEGGGIGNQTTGQVLVTNSTIAGNNAGAFAGGIFMNDGGKLTLSTSTISGNIAATSGGGVYLVGSSGTFTIDNSGITLNRSKSGFGGGIELRSGTLTVTKSTVSSNSAFAGGGIDHRGGVLTIYGSTIDGNSATFEGGGILHSISSSDPTATMVVNGSTISNNSGSEGGGLYIGGSTSTIRNSTIAKNTAKSSGGAGGGFYLSGMGTVVNIQNSTVALNAAIATNGRGGGFYRTAGTLNLSSSIIADNKSSAGGMDGDSTSVTITLNNSLIGSDIAGDGITYTGTGQTNVAAGLDPAGLALNGAPAGTPLTIALQTGSLAINSGNNFQMLPTDARGAGFYRIVGAAADVGAFELQSGVVFAAKISAVTINSKLLTEVDKAQRSYVSDVAITFDSKIAFAGKPEAAFTLTNVNGGVVTLAADIDNSGPGTVVTLSFTGGAVNATSLSDGRYALHVLASQIAGPGLDGDGNGTGGDDFIFDQPAMPASIDTGKIFRLFGDYNGNGRVTVSDFIQLRLAFGNNSQSFQLFDFDNDGAVGASDFIQFRLRLGG